MGLASLDEYMMRVGSGPPLKENEEMVLEILRLASYENWPHWALKRPGDLSQNGFYYCGDKDRVCCFYCNTEISSWAPDDRVSDKHRTNSPSCGFVQGQITGNVPLEDKNRLHCDSPKSEVASGSIDGETKSNDSGFGGSIVNSASSGASSLNKMHSDLDVLLEELKSMGSITGSQSTAATDDVIDTPKETEPEQREPGTDKMEEVNLQFVKYESYRLRTYEGNWSSDSFISPAELAKAGFFFISAPDRVQCAFCKGRLLNWKPTDVPLTEHRRHFKDCPFVLGRNVGNVPIEQSLSSVQYPEHMLQKEKEKKKKDQSPSERLGIMMDKPKHSDYAIEASRYDSFKTWPKNAKVPADKLANAGFFYVGYSDNVKCFFCDGGLRNWDSGDDPWREHARWFSRCGYVKLQMGEEYVNKVIADSKAADKGTRRTADQTQGGAAKNPKRKSPPPYDPRELKARLDTNMVRTVIDMGFPKELVAKVLETRLKTEGDDYSTAEALLQALLEEQEAQTMERDRKDISEKMASEDTKPGMSRRKKRNRKKKNKKTSSDEGGKSAAAAYDSDSEVEEVAEVIDESTRSMVQQDPEVQSLIDQYHRIKEERTCKICMDEECTVVFLPCGHLVCCANCAPALRTCPICRTLIKGSVRIFTT